VHALLSAQTRQFGELLAVVKEQASQPSTAAVLAEQIKQKDLLDHQQWRRERASCKMTAALLFKTRDEAKIDADAQLIVSLCQSDDPAFTPEQVMALSAGCFSSLNREHYATLVLRVRDPAERVKLHNWLVAESYGEDWVASYGHQVALLTWPLFPNHSKFQALNAFLLASVGTGAVGGGSSRRDPAARYFRSVPGMAVGGAVLLPCVPGPDGQGYVVDVQPIADAFVARDTAVQPLVSRVAALERSLSRVQSAPAVFAPQVAAIVPPAKPTPKKPKKPKGGAAGGDPDEPDFQPVQ
jgi:hypothetical protein